VRSTRWTLPTLHSQSRSQASIAFDVGSSGEVTLVTVRKGEGDATGDGPAVRVRSNERARFSGVLRWRMRFMKHPGSMVSTIGAGCAIAVKAVLFRSLCFSWRKLDMKTLMSRFVASSSNLRCSVGSSVDWSGMGALSVRPLGMDQPWGWTWVDDAAWGFAPFHYGRWVYAGYWAWSPGPVYVRPIYAPASGRLVWRRALGSWTLIR